MITSPNQVGETRPSEAVGVDAGPEADTPSRRRRPIFRVFKWIVVLVVLLAIVWQFRGLANDWNQEGTALFERGLAWPWLVAALAIFMLGQLCFALYWRRLVRATGIEAPLLQSVRAYLVGTLGKYVPGKAVVILLRAGLLPTAHGRRLVVGGVTIYETLTSMAAAGVIAAAALIMTYPTLQNNILGALFIAIALNVAVYPRVFAWMSRWVALPFGRDGSRLPVRDWYRCYWRSAPLWVMQWLGSGLSLWAVAAAFRLDVWSWQAVVFMTGVASLGTVAGFLVLPVPAGVGVREFVMILLLEKWYALDVAGAHAIAVAMSLVLRTIWTIGELSVAGALYALPGVSWARAKAANMVSLTRA